jgi:predicted ABC-type ATPase
MSKKIFMIAGPNGAGKTTTAMAFLSNSIIDEYINADEIARGLAPCHPESVALEASKLMIKRLKELLEGDKNFAFETTGAGRNYVRHLKEAQANGYEIHLLFLWLHSADLAVERVALRVKLGGHNIPEDVIRRRYHLGLKNLVNLYLPIANSALVLDNSGPSPNQVIYRKQRIEGCKIRASNIWQKIQGIANAI